MTTPMVATSMVATSKLEMAADMQLDPIKHFVLREAQTGSIKRREILTFRSVEEQLLDELVAAGLLSVAGDTFTLTEQGRDVLRSGGATRSQGRTPDGDNRFGTDPATPTQDEFARLIRSENNRLNRLIMNLYLKFSLEPLPDEDIFYSACHGIAEYFHADCCEILLSGIRQEKTSGGDKAEYRLNLAGAFGAWERAMNSPFVRRNVDLSYPVPDDLQADPGNTTHFWVTADPQAFSDRGDFRGGHDRPEANLDDVPHQQAWFNDSLAGSCRNILGAQLTTRTSGNEPPGTTHIPDDGVLKVENKRPAFIDAFREHHEDDLVLKELWAVTILRPYVRYLKRKNGTHAEVFHEHGWTQQYEGRPRSKALFDELRQHGQEIDQDAGDSAPLPEALIEELGLMEEGLADLLTLTISAETFLQHLRFLLKRLFPPKTEEDAPARQVLARKEDGWETEPEDSPAREPLAIFNIAKVMAALQWAERQALESEKSESQLVKLRELRESLQQKVANAIACKELASSHDVDQAIDRVKQLFLQTLDWKTDRVTLNDIRGDKLKHGKSSLNYERAIGFLHDLLNEVANVFREMNPNHYGGDGQLRWELRRAITSAERATGISHPPGVPGGKWAQSQGSRFFERALRKAAFYVHTFSHVDRARMLFVSRRVSLLLNNHVIRTAKTHGIDITHDQSQVLHIDEYALKSLVSIENSLEHTVSLLQRAIVWHAGVHGDAVEMPVFDDQPQRATRINRLLEAACQRERRRTDDTSEDRDRTGQHRSANDTAPPDQGVSMCELDCVSTVVPKVVAAKIQDHLVESNERLAGDICLQVSTAEVRDATTTRSRITIRCLYGLPDHFTNSIWLGELSNGLEQFCRELANWVRRSELGPIVDSESMPAMHRPARIAGPGRWQADDAPEPTATGEADSCLGAAPDETQPDETQPEKTPRAAQDARLRKLREGLDRAIGQFANSDEGSGGKSISDLCAAIAKIVECDSCAIFLLNDDNKMEMKGAFGRLAETLEKKVDGVVYKTYWDPARHDGLSRDELEKEIRPPDRKPWPLTNQIWHLGEGRIANSRQEFDEVSGRKESTAKGQGDKFAYPVDYHGAITADEECTFRHVFRSLIAIPIFARGGSTDFDPQPERDRDAMRAEFHRQYRVIGILKLEGKLPPKDEESDKRNKESPEEVWFNLLSEDHQKTVTEALGDRQINDGLLEGLFRRRRDASATPKDDGSPEFGKRLFFPDESNLDSEIIDAITDAAGARWTAEDGELLVAIAMEIGRLQVTRTLRKANQAGLLLSESEIGLLDIREDDIDSINAMKAAAEVVGKKVEFELRVLQRELTREKRADLRLEQPRSEEPHDVIRTIDLRVKEFPSLVTKLAAKELSQPPARDRSKYEKTVTLPGRRQVQISTSDGLESGRQKVRGTLELEVSCEGQSGEIVGTKGSLWHGNQKMSSKTQDPPNAVPDAQEKPARCHRSFAARVLEDYGIDDWAGVRVVCYFLSDLEIVLDAMRARFPARGILVDPDKIERWLEAAQPDGYRGIHVTVSVPIRGLLPDEVLQTLSSALNQGDLAATDLDDLTFPCEIQIRTAYQHSWSAASHQITYKRTQPHDLMEYMRYLSGLLYQSDNIMEIVRQTIESTDERELEFFMELRDRLPDDLFFLVQFGVTLAKCAHQEHRLYGGQPHFSRLIDVAHRLAHDCRIDDPFMLLIALFEDLRLYHPSLRPPAAERPGDTELVPWREGVTASDYIADLRAAYADRLLRRVEQAMLEDQTGLLERMTALLFVPSGKQRAEPSSFPQSQADQHARLEALRRWLTQVTPGDDAPGTPVDGVGESCPPPIPPWFWLLLNVCWESVESRAERNFQGAHRWDLIMSMFKRLNQEPGDLPVNADEFLRRAANLEAVVQLRRLSELPDQPVVRTAIAELESIYASLEKIRRRVGSDIRPVLRFAEMELRLAADKLRTHLPIDWEN